jgi:large conductance mechanosensitive channel
MSKAIKEFKDFAFKGNVVDLAVAVILGTAFGKIIASLVNDVFMPVLSLLTGGMNVSGLFVQLSHNEVAYTSIETAKEAGVATLNYGLFIQTVIDFLLIALCIFLFVKAISKMRRKQETAPVPAPRLCKFCRLPVADDATRCPHCTSELTAAKKV